MRHIDDLLAHCRAREYVVKLEISKRCRISFSGKRRSERRWCRESQGKRKGREHGKLLCRWLWKFHFRLWLNRLVLWRGRMTLFGFIIRVNFKKLEFLSSWVSGRDANLVSGRVERAELASSAQLSDFQRRASSAQFFLSFSLWASSAHPAQLPEYVSWAYQTNFYLIFG